MGLDELEQRIKEQGNLSPVNRQIADYVLHHLRDVSLMSATDLAEASGVSQPSVSRFCMGLGYQGYADFVRVIQDLVREEWRAPDRAHYLRYPSSEEEPLIAEEIANLSMLQSLCQTPAVEQLVQFILRSRRLVLAGARASATMIPYASYFLSKVRDGVEVATPDAPLWSSLASHAQPDVAVLAFVFPRYAASLLEWLDDVSRWATPIAAITDRPQSPARQWARPLVVVPVARASLFDSYAAPMVLLNYLIRRVASHTPAIETRLQELEQYESRRQVYQK
jgi:DNA-binding MurR/RpiR family transcriptional regulator